MKLLLVEDEEAHGELISEAFEDHLPDTRIEWVRTTEAAGAALERGTFDVLILDVNLPDGTCLDVLSNPARQGCPAIVLTARGQASMAVLAMKAGALDYLEKSVATFEALPHVARATAREGAAMVRMEQAERRMRHADRLIGAGRMAALTAHEVGTPLNVVRMGLQGLGQQGDPELTALSESLIGQLDLVTRRLRGMLDYARSTRPRRQIVPLLATATGAVELVGPLLRRAGVVVEVEGAESYVLADAEQVQQVVFNLLTNAAQAGASTVSIVGSADDHSATLQVRDNGPGIAPEARHRLFDAFFTTKAAGKGTGLGLAVCARIATDHGGRLTLEDVSPGACFVFTLPVA